MAGRSAYWPELDGLRAIAVVAVVLFHSAPNGPFRGGFIGVDLFFVLSAFLITSILAADWRVNGQLDLRRFYWRRFLRLFPALLLMLAGYLLVAPFIWPAHPHGRDALVTVLYLSDYAYAFERIPLYLQHTWSLAIEEHFYLLWPIALIPLLKTKKPVLWLGLAYVLATLWRVSFSDWQQYYYRFDTHASGLILGALLFFALPKFKPMPAFAFGGLAVLCLIFATGQIFRAATVITAAELASAALIACAVTRTSGALGTALRHPVMVTVGKLSYAIYLWHFPIAYALRPHFSFAVTSALTLGASAALAAFSYVTVEAWARRMKSGDRMVSTFRPSLP